VEEARAAEDYEPKITLLGKALFWLGIVVLDVLFVLLVLWLFVPPVVLSQKIFWSTGGTGIALGLILVSYSLTRRV
jgi:energy-coupling factor transporter transmembrane protein EcfT